MPVEYLSPRGMHINPAFTQGIIIPANAKTLLIGGQNAVNADGEILGKGDLTAQTAKALDNLHLVLKSAGADWEHLIKVSLYIVGDADIRPAFGEWMKRWGQRANPPSVTMLRVIGLGNPDFLIEIEGLAILP